MSEAALSTLNPDPRVMGTAKVTNPRIGIIRRSVNGESSKVIRIKVQDAGAWCRVGVGGSQPVV